MLRWSISLAAHLPFADVPVSRPPVWLILAFYAMLCLPLIPLSGWRIRWGFRCGPVAACFVVLLTPWLLGSAHQSARPDRLQITLLSVGAGQCAVIEPPSGNALMVDAGSTTLTDPLHMCVGPFLHHEGRTSLGQIYLSHGDFDHINAAEGLVDEFGVGQVITTPFFRRHAGDSYTCRHLLATLDNARHSPKEVVIGDGFSWGEGIAAQVLWPPKQCVQNSNNAAMVLRLTYAGRSILFPADIQDPAMAELLKSPARLRSDVLIAAHHGSSEPLTAAFVQAVNPEVIISSNAARLTRKQRDFTGLIEHRPLFRTSECGAVTIEIDRNGLLTVTPFLKGKQPMITIDRDGKLHPG